MAHPRLVSRRARRILVGRQTEVHCDATHERRHQAVHQHELDGNYAKAREPYHADGLGE